MKLFLKQLALASSHLQVLCKKVFSDITSNKGVLGSDFKKCFKTVLFYFFLISDCFCVLEGTLNLWTMQETF